METTAIKFRLANDDDVPALRQLVNAAYQQLADLGLNFTGTFQDEAITRERMQGCDVYLAYSYDALVGTVTLEEVEPYPGETPALYISQLAVAPEFKRQGLGRLLLRLAEEKARKKGLPRLRLDTAIPATHLVTLYRSEGYEVVKEVQWEGKVYRSYIMDKMLQE